MRNICENVSSRSTDLFCRFCWNESARSLFPATTNQPFLQSLSSHYLCSCLEILSTTNNVYNFWHSKLQQVSTHAFCSWDDIVKQKWNCSSPKTLCKCTKSPSTLSTNTFTEWNLYVSWSNHLVTSFRLAMNVGGFPEHQNKTSETDRYKGYFFTARVSQVNVNTMEGTFEQRSELQVAKCLIFHALSSSYNVSSLEHRNKRKATQQCCLRVTNDIVFNQVGVYHERVYADNVVSKLSFVRSFPSQHYFKFNTEITSESVSQIRSKECKIRPFIFKVNLVLRSLRHFSWDTNFALIVSFLNESVHGLNNIRKGRANTRLQIVEFWRLWKLLVKKHTIFLRDILVPCWVGFF